MLLALVWFLLLFDTLKATTCDRWNPCWLKNWPASRGEGRRARASAATGERLAPDGLHQPPVLGCQQAGGPGNTMRGLELGPLT